MDYSDSLNSGSVPKRRPAKVSELIAREILQDIADQKISPGTKLPSEIEMSERFGVARASLREGLRILEIHGLITIKPGPGGGPVVDSISSSDLAQTLTFFLQASNVTVRDVVQARLILEPVMARQAAEKVDPELNDSLKQSIEKADQAVDSGSHEEYLKVKVGFHQLISAASGNGILALLGGALQEIYLSRMRPYYLDNEERKKISLNHKKIAEAIASGDGDKAEELMRSHMEESVGRIEERLTGFLNEKIGWS